MQPEEPGYPAGRAPAAGWPPGRYAGEFAPPRADGPLLRRSRAWLVVLIAFVVELVIIAGIGNPAVSDRIAESIGPDSGLGSNAARAALVYRWRVTAASGDTYHVWLAELALVGTVLVLTALLVWAAARGPAGFGRAFVGTWTAVVVATLVGMVVRGVVIDPGGYTPYPGGRLNAALFGPLAPNGITCVAGLALGLVVALAAGLTAASARRTVGVVVPAPAPDAYAPGEPYPSEHTQELPRVDVPLRDEPGDTAALPRAGAAYDPYRRPAVDDGEHTTQFPRVPPDQP